MASLATERYKGLLLLGGVDRNGSLFGGALQRYFIYFPLLVR